MNFTESGTVKSGPEPEAWVSAKPCQESIALAEQNPESRRLLIQFCPDSFADPTQDILALEEKFEALLIGLLSKLLNVPDSNVDCEIGGALGRLCSVLGLDHCGFWYCSPREPDSFVLTQQGFGGGNSEAAAAGTNGSSQAQNAAQMDLQIESKTCLPWVSAQLRRGERVVFSSLAELPSEAEQDKLSLARFNTRSSVVLPFFIHGEVAGAVSFEMLGTERTWSKELVRRMELITEVFAGAIARKLASEALKISCEELKRLQERLPAESEYLKNEAKLCQSHGQIIGRSPVIKKVLRQVEQVAPAECAVLINGETGTGKELVAQEIHRLSRRKDHPMVLVNCAALPSALVESELFGREKGAYTGALTSQVGRFEVADGSTIFLDEVGELSLEVQAKLLRVLQDGEFQRLGSPKMHRVDVRVIAATNRDLAAEVRKGRFREDLYYRLKVFPIDIPPLRARVEDIPPLVFSFIEEFSSRMGKKITKVPCKAMATLQKHAWPGNIRELRNVIEHSVILSSGDMLKLSFVGEAPVRETQPVTLADAEKEHILRTLESTGWRIKGPHGAAVRLDVQPSTLYSRMQKLGIPHRRQKDAMAGEG